MNRAILVFLSAIGCMATPCHADSIMRWGDSAVELQVTEHPGAVAQVTFHNALVHIPDSVTADLDLGSFAVQVSLIMGRGKLPDSVALILPPGYIAVPPEAVVPENSSAVFLIFSTDAVGS
jgi:hypothetical protein